MGRDSVSNHQPHGCLLNRLFRRRSKKTSKLRVTGLWAGNSPGTGEFPAQMASNAENVSIWWRHHIRPLKQSRSTPMAPIDYLNQHWLTTNEHTQDLYSQVVCEMYTFEITATSPRETWIHFNLDIIKLYYTYHSALISFIISCLPFSSFIAVVRSFPAFGFGAVLQYR